MYNLKKFIARYYNHIRFRNYIALFINNVRNGLSWRGMSAEFSGYFSNNLKIFPYGCRFMQHHVTIFSKFIARKLLFIRNTRNIFIIYNSKKQVFKSFYCFPLDNDDYYNTYCYKFDDDNTEKMYLSSTFSINTRAQSMFEYIIEKT